MPLLSPSGDPITISDKEYWKDFEDFEESDLHRYFIEKIKIKDTESLINSSYFGKEVLEELKKVNLELYVKYKSKNLGGLFGMTLLKYYSDHESNRTLRKKKYKDSEKTFYLYTRDD